jgi:hypothetical protein
MLNKSLSVPANKSIGNLTTGGHLIQASLTGANVTTFEVYFDTALKTQALYVAF